MTEPVLDTLPPPQRQLWDEHHATPAHFVLYGGTALALRLAHRESEDFDFLSTESFDADRLLAEVPYLRGAHVLQRENDTDLPGGPRRAHPRSPGFCPAERDRAALRTVSRAVGGRETDGLVQATGRVTS